MRIAGESIGARGGALLAIASVAGILLGMHGWSMRHHGLPAAGLTGGTPAASAPASAAPGATQGPRPPATRAAGPKLSSQSYAAYAFQVWPAASSAARAAATGLVIRVSRQGPGISVRAGVAGQPLPAATYYPAGAKVYVIEASMGDDAGGADYNLGDDGLVVTDAQGRIVQ